MESALEAIRGGSVEKVVLARAERLPREGGPGAAPGLDLDATIEALRRAEPRALAFAIAPAGARRAFVGATPERLARLEGRRASTVALAGTAPRSPDPREDALLGRRLRESEKDAREHALVVAAIEAALRPLAARLDRRPRRAVRLARVRHLATPVEVDLAAPSHVLALAALLHPTPAVGGAPREAALRLLEREAGPARGWYAGAVGWLDARGGGDLHVAIRSALLEPGAATLFAGAGIVRGSDAAREWAETEAKLGALAAALGLALPGAARRVRTPRARLRGAGIGGGS